MHLSDKAVAITSPIRFKEVNIASPPSVHAATMAVLHVYGPGGGFEPPARCGRTGGEWPRALERSARPARPMGATEGTAAGREASADGGFATSWVRLQLG